MLKKEDVFEQLRRLGAPQDKPVIVHLSLKAIGEIEGRAEGLLDAFIEYFTAKGGLLIVPAHTWDNFYQKRDPVLDMTSGYTCIGTFPGVAAADIRGIRTFNPTHSLCVFGEKKRAEAFAEKENAVDTPTSPTGSYGEIIKQDGYVLLLGVGQEKNTLLHCVEEMLGVKNRLSDSAVPMRVKLKDGTPFDKKFYYMISDEIEDVSVFFPKYEPAFRYHGGIADGVFGNAKAQLCSARIMQDTMKLIYDRSGGKELLSDDAPIDIEFYVASENVY